MAAMAGYAVLNGHIWALKVTDDILRRLVYAIAIAIDEYISLKAIG